jgi:hypothetical protein
LPRRNFVVCDTIEIMRYRLIIPCVASALFAAACHTPTHTTETTETTESTHAPRPNETAPIAPKAATADDYIASIQAARTPAEEADAIRKLRQWELANGLTYRIQTTRIEDNAAVDPSSAGVVPVRAHVTIYRGRDVLRTFNFAVKDNRNLALFGE